MTLIGILYYDEELGAAEAAGTISGSTAIATRWHGCCDLFELPDPVELKPVPA